MKSQMPVAVNLDRPNCQWELKPQARERWTPEITAASDNNVISILDPIGADPFTGDGTTAKRISAALRSIGAEKDVVVAINSPGGDVFEGMAIYNLLREHKGDVTVKVLGLAASAASIIAMAGDEVMIARSGFVMIHNVWVLAVGNRNDLRDMADMLQPFDEAMADIYSARTGMDSKVIMKMMDKETWISGSAAVDQGFADSLLPADEVKKDAASRREVIAKHRMESALSRGGLSRSESRALMNEFKSGMRDAAGSGTRDAAGNGTRDAAEVRDAILSTFKEYGNA